MLNFLCIVVDAKTKKDVKEYEVEALCEIEAAIQARAMYRVASHYTPRLPKMEDVSFEVVVI